jgi:hypothetical protein
MALAEVGHIAAEERTFLDGSHSVKRVKENMLN